MSLQWQPNEQAFVTGQSNILVMPTPTEEPPTSRLSSASAQPALNKQPDAPAQPSFQTRPDASMTLLTEVMERPLDPSYAAATARRQAEQLAGNARKPAPVTRVIQFTLAVLLGITTTVAAMHLQLPDAGAREIRLSLENQIVARTEAIAQKTENINTITAEISSLQESALTATDPAIADLLQTDELHNGRTPLTGPGLVITLTDGGGGLTEITSEHLVRDVDLQQVVQALWAAGAEAIAIGDQRLTMTTAIRNAGDAVLIDLVPVLGPTFTVYAIGNSAAMEASWATSGIPEYLAMLGAEFGIRSTVTEYSDITVPNASPPVLRYAQPVDLASGAGNQNQPARIQPQG